MYPYVIVCTFLSIKHHEYDKYLQEHLQATSVCINDNNNVLIISAVYCSPQYKVDEKKCTEFLVNSLDKETMK
jgi:hypothetical protein